jgi:hypothetical protein
MNHIFGRLLIYFKMMEKDFIIKELIILSLNFYVNLIKKCF